MAAEGKGLTADHYKTVVRKMTPYLELAQGVDDSQQIKKLDNIPKAIAGYFKESPHKWVFVPDGDSTLLPYLITEVKYIPQKGGVDDYVPAHVDIKLEAYRRGQSVSIRQTWWARNLPATVPQLMKQHDFYRETEDAVNTYIEEFKRYTRLTGEIGTQMTAYGEGTALRESSWGWKTSKSVPMVRDGIPAKVVLDDTTEEDDSNTRGRDSSKNFVINKFWDDVPNPDFIMDIARASGDHQDGAEAVDNEEVNKNAVVLPVHNYIKVFDLQNHEWLIINSANLRDYEWDTSLIDKLVLKPEHKGLINMLMTQTEDNIEDIIKGKMGGVIVLATGNPGLGKTLTAEVFSETIKKPLFVVQCSQLGLNVDQVEKNLGEVLSRAGRWGAILLIDEADVYIRQRGEDIIQNAIVGVFLRLIEYYPGILFMTSNRGEIIDDAILSRATAWIKYEAPDPGLLIKIWEVLGKQYGAEFSAKDLADLTEAYQGISGRSVRNLLKLSRMHAVAADTEMSVQTVAEVADYQALEPHGPKRLTA